MKTIRKITKYPALPEAPLQFRKYRNVAIYARVSTSSDEQLNSMGLYIRTLKKSTQIMTEWNDAIWTVMVEKAVVHRDGSVTFVFYNGNKIKVGA